MTFRAKPREETALETGNSTNRLNDLQYPDSCTAELARWEQLGRDFVKQYRVSDTLLIGFGNRNLGDGHDPWGVDCRVAAVSYMAPGAASILGAGMPLGGDRWYTLRVTDKGGFSFRDRTSDYLSMIFAIFNKNIIIGDCHITAGTKEYYLWIGFLSELQTVELATGNKMSRMSQD
jgi:hypothetical protein